MTTQRKAKTIHSQKGAVAIIVALSLLTMIGVLGLVLDLGHLYVAKTELQNAADAAALSGAKQLDGTSARICCGSDSAQARAIEAAGLNNFNLNTTPVTITSTDLEFSSSPDGPWVSVAEAQAAPSDKTFLKVDTSLVDFNTWFIQVLPGVASTMQTFGMAVAGKYQVDVTPIGICELPNDPANNFDNELGYERGVTYRVSDANPLGPGTPFWIDPEATSAGTCSGDVPTSLPYLCAGKVAFTPIVGQTVYTNTGFSTPQLAALDSRFDTYPPQAGCNFTTAPPDTNIRQYRCTNKKGENGCLKNTDSEVGLPREWMEPNPPQLDVQGPTQQSITFEVNPITGYAPKLLASRSFADYGVLWSAARRSGAVATDWPTIYGGSATGYPEPSPYAQTSGNFDKNPNVTHPAKSNRRVLNVVIVKCTTSGGNCRPAEVSGVGRFVLQRQANIPGDNDIYLEFLRLLPTPLPTSDIKLYR